MFGLKDKQELINVHPSEVSPEFQLDGQSSITKADEMIQIALKKGVNRFEWMHKRKNGVVFPAEVLLSAFEYGGEIVIQATVQDITERKKAEETIKQSLHEKEVLLKEVHHRVKNNLQTVSALLRLQARRIEDPGASSALRVA